jgi:isopentenyl-diphosphate Delta-isomerase
MTDELFDVVNERDEVVGVKPRREVHRLGLMHRAVHVLVYEAAGRIFLQKRSMLKDSHPGKWDSSASGHVDSGETYEGCARRELFEELGIHSPGELRPLFKIQAGPHTDQEHVWVYRCMNEGPFKLQPSEIDEGAWFDCQTLDSWMANRPEDFATAFRTIWLSQKP